MPSAPRQAWLLPPALLLVACSPSARVSLDASSACSPGDTIVSACGLCGLARSQCVDGVFVKGPCDEPDACGVQPCQGGDVQHRACRFCGEQVRTCTAAGSWGDWGACDTSGCGQDAGARDAGPECLDGDLWQQACGACGRRERVCSAGLWQQWSACVECADVGQPDGAVAPDAATKDAAVEDAGARDAGLRPDAAVVSKQDAGCSDGDRLALSCGLCGIQTSTCSGGVFGSYGTCHGEGMCTPGAVETATCGSSSGACTVGQHSRTCGTDCGWSAWSPCSGSSAVEEVCGNGLDDDCDGATDEGCQCATLAPGATASFAVTDSIARLLADPVRCAAYGLTPGAASKVLVYDVAQKAQVASISLGAEAQDLAIDPTGSVLVVTEPTAGELVFIDPATRAVVDSKVTLGPPWAVEALDADRILYTTNNGELRRYTRSTAADQKVGDVGTYLNPSKVELELGTDRTKVWTAEYAYYGAIVRRFDALGSPSADTANFQVDRPIYDANPWHLTVGGHRLYTRGYQYDEDTLGQVVGAAEEIILATDRAGRFAVGTKRVFDAGTMRPLAFLPSPATAAAPVAGDREIWSYDAVGGVMNCQNATDVLGSGLGVRALPVPSAWPFHFAEMAVDPTRPALYGLDPLRGTLVSVSTATLEATSELFIGNSPTRLGIDPDGRYAYVGFELLPAVAIVDLATGTYQGALPTSSPSVEVVALSRGRFASTASDTSSGPIEVGQVAAWTATTQASIWPYEPRLAATPDGMVLFVAESGLSTSCATRFDASLGDLVEVVPAGYCTEYAGPYVRVAGDGRILFYDNVALDGPTVLYGLITRSIASTSPDGHLVLTGSQVFDALGGMLLGSLPQTGLVQAVSTDSKTLFLATPSGIAVIDLSAY